MRCMVWYGMVWYGRGLKVHQWPWAAGSSPMLFELNVVGLEMVALGQGVRAG